MINWNALGSTAEFVAAIGVIASLVYLAVQIRQNTQSIRASTYEAMVRGSGEFLLPLIQDRDLAKSFERAVDRWSQMDYEEQVQVMYLLTQLFRNWENAYYQYRQGTLEPWLWESWQHVVLSYFHRPGVQDWWKLRRAAYSKPFREFLESSSRPDTQLSTTGDTTGRKTVREP
jgi:hypothetical protein